MDRYAYYVVATLVAAAITIIPKVLPLFFLRGKTFNKRLMIFFKIVPFTSMTVLILKEVLTIDPYNRLMIIVTITISAIVSYITENMVLTVFASIFTTFIYSYCLSIF